MRISREVQLDKEDVDWFKTTYPKGSLSWLFTIALKEFRAAHTTSPTDYVRVGAAELKSLISDEDKRASTD